jgi:hypothetical protein
MRTAIITVMAVVLASFVIPSPSSVRADELQDQIQALRKKAAELKAMGREKVAEDLARQAAELAQTVKPQQAQKIRPNISKAQILKLEELLKDLLDKEQQMRDAGAPLEDIELVERHILSTESELDKLRSAIAKPALAKRNPMIPPEAMAKLEKAGLQIKHMRIAAENLEAAGATELAGQIREKADALEKEARAAKAELLKSASPQSDKELEKIRAEVVALREEVAQLRNELKQIIQRSRRIDRVEKKQD